MNAMWYISIFLYSMQRVSVSRLLQQDLKSVVLNANKRNQVRIGPECNGSDRSLLSPNTCKGKLTFFDICQHKVSVANLTDVPVKVILAQR